MSRRRADLPVMGTHRDQRVADCRAAHSLIDDRADAPFGEPLSDAFPTIGAAHLPVQFGNCVEVIACDWPVGEITVFRQGSREGRIHGSKRQQGRSWIETKAEVPLPGFRIARRGQRRDRRAGLVDNVADAVDQLTPDAPVLGSGMDEVERDVRVGMLDLDSGQANDFMLVPGHDHRAVVAGAERRQGPDRLLQILGAGGAVRPRIPGAELLGERLGRGLVDIRRGDDVVL